MNSEEKGKLEFIHCAQKMKLAMNSTIYFHAIILITKENWTLNKILETDVIHFTLNFKESMTSKTTKILDYCYHYIVIVNKDVCPPS